MFEVPQYRHLSPNLRLVVCGTWELVVGQRRCLYAGISLDLVKKFLLFSASRYPITVSGVDERLDKSKSSV